MADYKDIHGTTVRNNDGVLTSAKTGELFYDSTNRNFSYRFPNVTSAGAWRTGNNLNVGRNPNETLRILDALQTDELCPCNRPVGGNTL